MGQIRVEKNMNGITGLCVIEPAVHGDARGYFMETYNERDMREAGIDALMDEEIQRLAWENHGFRTEVSGTGADEDHFGVPHLAAEITQVAAMPSYAAMEKIIAALS